MWELMFKIIKNSTLEIISLMLMGILFIFLEIYGIILQFWEWLIGEN